MYSQLEKYYSDAYKEHEYPTLKLQREQWQQSKPFEGLTILDAAPLCRNSIYKYMNLIYGGAKLSVAKNELSSTDDHLMKLMQEAGIELVFSSSEPRNFDIIMDCAAQYLSFSANIGRTELTRSGAELYGDSKQPVFMADGGKIKLIETCIGTGESYFRAMDSLGYSNWENRRLVLFGCGKVGQGILRAAYERGIEVIVVTDPQTISESASRMASQIIDFRNTETVEQAVLSSYALVSATGQRGAVGRTISAERISKSEVLLANMGAEDEFGDEFETSRVLANKDSLNFILEDPTPLKYIDATLALHNYGAEYIISHKHEQGIIIPDSQIENKLLKQTLEHGCITRELESLSEPPYSLELDKI